MGEVAVSKAKYMRISPRKCRLVVDLIRDMDAGEALTVLKFSKKKKAAGIVYKVLNSAVANAQVKFPNVDVDNLFISRAFVDEAPSLKRFRAVPRGRGVRILKRYSHVTIYLSEKEEK